MFNIIYKIFPSLSKKQNVMDEKQYLDHWKNMPHFTVNQIAYLYNHFQVPTYQHKQNFENLSKSESETASMMHFQLLAAIEANQLIAKNYVHQSEPAKNQFNKKKPLFLKKNCSNIYKK
ncbi:MAG: hypothetical protein KZQ83_17530 [gamma proteobacterium symbiont of Taylorina sp.]|nr:hypothetical protein [gamma proteobacterium symbiont of Taylorina sp.]